MSAKLVLIGSLLAMLTLAGVRAAEPLGTSEDPLPVGSLWKGKLTQGGKTPGGIFFPPELTTELTITHRDGDAFEAELHESGESLDIIYLVRGTAARGSDGCLTIRFRSYAVKGIPTAGSYFLNVPYTAKYAGDTLKGTWTYEDKESDVALDGAFQLKRNDE